jgi:hypothetical protein
MHRALAVDNVKRLVGVVAVQLVFLAWFVIVHPGVKARRVENLFAAFLLVCEFDHINDFNGH